MSKWDEIKSRLEHLGGSVKLLADGHEVSLHKVHDGKRVFVSVYVDGYIKGKWTMADQGKPAYPEARFFRPTKSAVWSKKQLPNLKKIYGKKKAEEMVKPRVIAFLPEFGTERSAVAHLKKHFPDLEILEPKPADPLRDCPPISMLPPDADE